MASCLALLAGILLQIMSVIFTMCLIRGKLHKCFLCNMLMTCIIYALVWPMFAFFYYAIKGSFPCTSTGSPVTDGSTMNTFKVGYFVYYSEFIAFGELLVWLSARFFLKKMKFAKSVCNMMSDSEYAEGFIETKEYKEIASNEKDDLSLSVN